MEKKTFEQLLKDLEQVVKDLENKEITLDEAVEKYQKGLELSKACYQMLEDAEKLIVKEIKA
ncbi:exodeoxyribonuclease VII small subunit [Peloplasma aerotolerans]|jgi:exodeoxyribonuclease VII small subunit|uniref:Exodeoxyribonuclease 7 small subunit n=1 Tax=Peloplasma aerotolerans TaxID=3044389 RepID=A0AAW6U3P9_9MOLU|nr:exodeoxyribonuclease VII small subunit [Mariniplasma sp. M4Ah]MCR3905651.1 exodeoxyribonuclease VII small subunit [Mycoplasmatota bacterium]MDI6452505.1 exodeoxyribonuclease VII small subunit [Mariniplasma sp. M4Ah]MDR4968241.1 exodeoxyribonuclease VII small subunit [Acholeplasmataceae bacterium]